MSERLFLRLDGDPLQGPEANVPVGTLRAFPVCAELGRHVAHVLSYRETVPREHEVLERVLPDGSVRIVFNFGEAPSVGGVVGLRSEAVGAFSAPAVVSLRGHVDGLSVTLRPGAVAALLGVPAGEIAGAAVPLDELWRGDDAGAFERLVEQPDDATRATILQGILERRLRRIDGAIPSAALRAAELITASSGQRSVRDVAAAVGVGERRLQQLFHAHVGLSPRVWSRLARLHGCLRALRLTKVPDWAGLAVDCGFYDQSHLVNEFRAFCGITPTEFRTSGSSGSSKTAA